MYDLKRVLGCEQSAPVSELILSLALECLVRAEPVLNGLECPWIEPVVVFYVLDTPFLGLFRIDADDFPVKFALVEQTERAQHFYRSGFTQSHDLVHADLDDV